MISDGNITSRPSQLLLRVTSNSSSKCRAHPETPSQLLLTARGKASQRPPAYFVFRQHNSRQACMHVGFSTWAPILWTKSTGNKPLIAPRKDGPVPRRKKQEEEKPRIYGLDFLPPLTTNRGWTPSPPPPPSTEEDQEREIPWRRRLVGRRGIGSGRRAGWREREGGEGDREEEDDDDDERERSPPPMVRYLYWSPLGRRRRGAALFSFLLFWEDPHKSQDFDLPLLLEKAKS